MNLDELVPMPRPRIEEPEPGCFVSRGISMADCEEYGKAITRAVAERCAQICTERMTVYWNSTEDEPDPDDCADAIRREFLEMSK